ncbi:uncharacterized protein [Musca autumnalis]|uniref:uncharacterized protein n=1 Tax=Musca autumnalis TaxID=221902 RepID=UPI003CE9AF9F
MASQQDLFRELVFADSDDDIMSDREVEQEIMGTNSELPPNTSAAAADIAITSTPKVEIETVTPIIHATEALVITTPAAPPATSFTSSNHRATQPSGKPPVPCRMCSQMHPLYKCHSFKRLSLEKRLRAVAYYRYCYVVPRGFSHYRPLTFYQVRSYPSVA